MRRTCLAGIVMACRLSSRLSKKLARLAKRLMQKPFVMNAVNMRPRKLKAKKQNLFVWACLAIGAIRT